MSKIRIYIQPDQIKDFISITDRETIHKIKDVLRIKSSQPVYVFDGCGKEYLYLIKEISKNLILLNKEKLLQKESYPGKRVTLAFPLEKEERIDFILQKSTELGVFRFIPFICQRSLKKIPSTNRLNRWKRIVIEAARQSQRLWIPQIQKISSLQSIAKLNFDFKIVGTPAGSRLNKKFAKRIADLLLVIGPVGDFSPIEHESLNRDGFHPIKLSANLLRTETAAIFAVGLVNNFLDES